ncbi:hypothetical protein [Streptomyces litchfieldiae]|uniref:Uncharacterized protein n=1 Tax=Streptomyces litchfieldiae TaxID=3075543 RepID=A0ABU2N1S9_9ACTN|nr:hypothetical protein [Streptomyces sp. DSM 44938]MDT0347562.1 hypothetical protein [Streptomyces sp. DSM 44938]
MNQQPRAPAHKPCRGTKGGQISMARRTADENIHSRLMKGASASGTTDMPGTEAVLPIRPAFERSRPVT